MTRALRGAAGLHTDGNQCSLLLGQAAHEGKLVQLLALAVSDRRYAGYV